MARLFLGATSKHRIHRSRATRDFQKKECFPRKDGKIVICEQGNEPESGHQILDLRSLGESWT